MSKSNKLPRVSKPTKQNAFVLLSCFTLSSTIITALNAEPIQNPINTITQSSHDIEAEQALESSQATNYNENTTNSEIQNKALKNQRRAYKKSSVDVIIQAGVRTLAKSALTTKP